MKKYQVIGGQYNVINYGESNSLHGAKCIAQKHWEYWDNWQGWHVPSIYKTEDVKTIGKWGEREPYAQYSVNGKRWYKRDYE